MQHQNLMNMVSLMASFNMESETSVNFLYSVIFKSIGLFLVPGFEIRLSGGSVVKNLSASVGDPGDTGSIPGSRRSSGVPLLQFNHTLPHTLSNGEPPPACAESEGLVGSRGWGEALLPATLATCNTSPLFCFNWSVIDLRYHVSFRCTALWFW